MSGIGCFPRPGRSKVTQYWWLSRSTASILPVKNPLSFSVCSRAEQRRERERERGGEISLKVHCAHQVHACFFLPSFSSLVKTCTHTMYSTCSYTVYTCDCSAHNQQLRNVVRDIFEGSKIWPRDLELYSNTL